MRQIEKDMRNGVAAIKKREWLTALRSFNHVLAVHPGHSGALANKALALRGLGRGAEALACLDQVISDNPFEAVLHYNRGTVLEDLDRFDEAEESYRHALRLAPNHGNAHLNLASCLRRRGNYQGALASLELAAKNGISPAAISINRGNILMASQDWTGAVDEYGKACAANQSLGIAWEKLAVAHEYLGDAAASRQACEQAFSTGQSDGAKLLAALALSKIPDSVGQIRAERRRVFDELSTLDFRLDDPFVAFSGITAFASAYHGENELPLRQAMAEAYSRLAPSLTWTAPKLTSIRSDRRLRLGVLSEFMRPNHTIGRLYGKLLSSLNRDRFQVVCLVPPTIKRDSLGKFATDAEKVVMLPDNLAQSRKIIADENLDVLLYTDIGMGRLSYFLAFARLAPIQVSTYGHPITSGLSSVDYYLSSSLIEPADSVDHYCEKLIELPCLPQAPAMPDVAGIEAVTLADLGLPEDRHLYVCSQTLFKLHPDFDEALGEILRRDSKGVGVFIRAPGTDWQKRFLRRIAAKYPEVVSRLVFVGPFDQRHFMALLRHAHANLDTFHFSGGNSSFESFCVGSPVVTYPGQYMRSRVTSGYYRQMGVEGLVASSPEEYVQMALRLADDADWRIHVGQQLMQAVSNVCDGRFIPALEEFLMNVWGRT